MHRRGRKCRSDLNVARRRCDDIGLSDDDLDGQVSRQPGEIRSDIPGRQHAGGLRVALRWNARHYLDDHPSHGLGRFGAEQAWAALRRDAMRSELGEVIQTLREKPLPLRRGKPSVPSGDAGER